MVSYLFGRVDLVDELWSICHRESRCAAVGVHDRDAWLSRPAYWGQVRLGHLDRDCQPPGPGWATRGAWGLSAAAHWPYLPECYDPAWLDWPIVSAIVAIRKYVRRCEPTSTRRWC